VFLGAQKSSGRPKAAAALRDEARRRNYFLADFFAAFFFVVVFFAAGFFVVFFAGIVFPPRNVHSMSLTMSLDIQEWTSCAEVSAPRSHTSSKRHAKFPLATRDARAIDPRESPRGP
jgi:hypothetical protein